MNNSFVDKIAEAVLYEGYILYPYRASSGKNRERFTFGRVYPRDYSVAQKGAEPFLMQTQCLVRGSGGSLSGRIRFLHAMAREVCAATQPDDAADFHVVPELRVDGRIFQTWHEAVEREVAIPEVRFGEAGKLVVEFAFPGSRTVEAVHDSRGDVAGMLRRRQRALKGEIELLVEPLGADVTKITVRISNLTPMGGEKMDDSGAVLLSTFASTHTILHAEGAEFISLTDPPPEYAEAASRCENIGAWPVLVGEEEKQERGTMLSSPIILYDYPQIAPESPGDLCDGTEIDEILTLRVLTMTDAEKCEMRNVDQYARRILERTEMLGRDDFMRMHGAMREASFPGGDFFDENTRLDQVSLRGAPLRAGDRVRINPKGRADAMDMLLAGKIGLIEAIEQDAENRVHLALVLEEDPGRDLGMMRQPGHRFFYTLDEVEPLREEE